MNYYEELGIRSDADEEEIRKAHRRLVKLMHPDQHRDQSLKQLAETQMRRLNSIVATLLDPEERQEYDEQLRGGDALHAAPHQSTWRSVPWWIASTLGAIILTVGTVYFFADRIGSHPNIGSTNPPAIEQPTEKQPDVTKVVVPPTTPAPVKKEEAATPPPQVQTQASTSTTESPSVNATKVPSEEKPKSAPVVKTADTRPAFPPAPVPDIKPSQAKVIEPPKAPVAPNHTATRKPMESVKTSPKPASRPPVLTAKSTPPPNIAELRRLTGAPVITAKPNPTKTLDANLGPPPLTTGSPAAPGIDLPTAPAYVAPAPRGSRDPLEGEWVYAPTEPEKHKAGLYPPDFIQLRLTKDTGGMRGEYSARYSITDNRPVSPTVSFVLKATDQKALHYVWTSADGSSGWLSIRSLEPDTMRLEWKATRFHGGPALTSGMATLVRKN